MFANTLPLLGIAVAITLGFFGYSYNKLRHFEEGLPRKVSYHFGQWERLSVSDIIKELKRRLSLNIQDSERSKYTEWLNEYHLLIRDMLVVKVLLFGEIILIIVLYIFLQN